MDVTHDDGTVNTLSPMGERYFPDGIERTLEEVGTGLCVLAYLKEIPPDDVELPRKFEDLDIFYQVVSPDLEGFNTPLAEWYKNWEE